MVCKSWEISLKVFKSGRNKRYKVTRRLPSLSVAETKVFSSKKKAQQLFEE